MNTNSSKKKSVRKIRAYRTFNRLLKLTLGKFLALRYNLIAENLEVFERVSAPYLVLPNHMSFWDPFFISVFVPDPVHYVTSDANFRSRTLRFLLGLVGSIPKTKLMSDYETIRHIMRIRDRKGVVGIFPEGRRTWDGHTLELLYATAKLIKLLKIPVIVPIFKGAYISLPRWTKRPRRGRITVSFTLLFTREELASSSVEEIGRKLSEALDYDEYEWQRTAMIPFKAARKAEYLELTLFACPACGGLATLYSKYDSFSCSACGYSVGYNDYGFFEKQSERLYFETVREWNLWQLEHLRAHISGMSEAEKAEAIFSDSNTVLLTGYRSNPLKRLYLGEMALYRDRIEFVPLKREKIVFHIRDIEGVNVQNNERFEFYHRGVLYRFNFAGKRTSSYKWLAGCTILQETARSAPEPDRVRPQA